MVLKPVAREQQPDRGFRVVPMGLLKHGADHSSGVIAIGVAFQSKNDGPFFPSVNQAQRVGPRMSDPLVR